MRPTPTVDRLAAPPTVANPSQADDGAQLFWLHCQPCHGDQGQGLTDEWRAQYPEEDQNCWTGGCHGNQPYEDGFTLPKKVPAVIGDASLERFATVGQVYDYVRAAMPFQDPGYLSQEEYLAITAFLARAHGVGDGRPLTAENGYEWRLKPKRPSPTGTPTATPAPTLQAVGSGLDQAAATGRNTVPLWAGLIIIMILVAVGGARLRRRN